MARILFSAVLVLVMVMLPVMAADPPEQAWSNSTEFGFVSVSGNAKSTNFALVNKFAFKMEKGLFNLDVGALRAASATMAASNVAGNLVVDDESVTTAERYFVDGKYRHELSGDLFWYVNMGWNKDRFAGIDSRWYGGGGVGYTFFKDDVHSFFAEVGVVFTDETWTDDAAGEGDSYSNIRGFAEYNRKVGASSKFEATLEVLPNITQSADLRATLFLGLTATMTEHLALKASFTTKYDGDPVVLELWEDDRLTYPDAVFHTLDEIDTTLAASLVINF